MLLVSTKSFSFRFYNLSSTAWRLTVGALNIIYVCSVDSVDSDQTTKPVTVLLYPYNTSP